MTAINHITVVVVKALDVVGDVVVDVLAKFKLLHRNLCFPCSPLHTTGTLTDRDFVQSKGGKGWK